MTKYRLAVRYGWGWYAALARILVPVVIGITAILSWSWHGLFLSVIFLDDALFATADIMSRLREEAVRGAVVEDWE